MERLNEAEHRRPDFVGGVPVMMIDNQEWTFAEPRMRLVPSDSNAGFMEVLSLDDDGTFDRIATEYTDLLFLPREDLQSHAMEYVKHEMTLGRMMLERNYNLTTDQIQRIFQVSHSEDDPIAYNIRLTVIKLVAGDLPKHSGGGDAPSATPPERSPSTTAC